MNRLNSTERWKIVIVEDNVDARSILVAMVSELGHRVADFENAESALAYLAIEPIDILVADVQLPGMSGELFAVEARAIQPMLGIVFATGSAAFSSKVNDGTTTVLLRKPFGLDDIEQALASVAPVGPVAPVAGSADSAVSVD